jgi:hypothetical protein
MSPSPAVEAATNHCQVLEFCGAVCRAEVNIPELVAESCETARTCGCDMPRQERAQGVRIFAYLMFAIREVLGGCR